MLLRIYLWGVVVAFVECLLVLRDDKGMVTGVEVIVSLLCSAALSWLLALAFFISLNIKHGQKKDNDKDIFGDDLAGT